MSVARYIEKYYQSHGRMPNRQEVYINCTRAMVKEE